MSTKTNKPSYDTGARPGYTGPSSRAAVEMPAVPLLPGGVPQYIEAVEMDKDGRITRIEFFHPHLTSIFEAMAGGGGVGFDGDEMGDELTGQMVSILKTSGIG